MKKGTVTCRKKHITHNGKSYIHEHMHTSFAYVPQCTEDQIKTKFTSVSLKTEMILESFHIYTQVGKRWY